MRPPICAWCGTWWADGPEDDPIYETITFADYEPLPGGMPGHPRGLEWFCAVHAEAVRPFAHLPAAAALDAARAAAPPPRRRGVGAWLRRRGAS